MPKSTAITIIIVAVLAIGGAVGFWYYNLSTDETPKDNVSDDNNQNLFPFGQNPNNTPNVNPPVTPTVTGLPAEAPEVREISAAPTSGFTTFASTSKNLTESFVRFIEQETGHVYEAPLQYSSKKRISNITIPKTREVIWLPEARGFIARYLGDNNLIQSFTATINLPIDDKSEGSVSGKFMTEGITNLSRITTLTTKTTLLKPAKVFYLLNEVTGASGYIANADGSKATKVFSSSLREWLSFPINGATVMLQTKSSGYAPSFLYSLNTGTGVSTKIMGNITGLSVLPNQKGTFVLYSETGRGTPRLHLYDVAKKVTLDLPLSTFADKCVWSETLSIKIVCAVPEGFGNVVYPDAWYQGKVVFSDNIWEIDTETLQTKEVLNLNNNEYYFDMDAPMLSDKDEYLVFRNKTNNSLWSVRLPR